MSGLLADPCSASSSGSGSGLADLPVRGGRPVPRRLARRGGTASRRPLPPATKDSRITELDGHDGPLVAAGVLLGVGLGGFFDGILLHQILQWHNMLSSVVPPTDLVSMKTNMIWDGLFHAFTWLSTVTGLALLWRATGRDDVPRRTSTFVGSLLLGWGLFNSVEGVIDHHILGIHHVHPGRGEFVWDIGFVFFGVVLMLIGSLCIRAGRR